MKKLAKLAALLAAGVLVFGFAACSGDDDDDVAVEGVTLDSTELTVTLGSAPVKLTATVLPEEADNKDVLWASDDDTIATVDENGVVTAVGAGTARITVTTVDGEYTDTCVVTVSDGTGNNGGGNGGGGGNGNFSTKTDDTTANDVATLGLVGTSADSSNPSVAKAKVEGGKIVITSHGAGSATITVRDADEHEATIEVTVAADGIITIGEITKHNADSDDDPPPTNVYTLTSANYTINLGKTNIAAQDYLEYEAGNYNSSAHEFDGVSDNYPNIGAAGREVVISVANVASFTLYVKNSTENRLFTVKVGSTTYTVSHPSKVNGSDIVPFTFNTGTKEAVSISVSGTNGSVYPGYIVLSDTAATIGVKSVEIIRKDGDCSPRRKQHYRDGGSMERQLHRC